MLTWTEFYDGDSLIVGFVLFLLTKEVGGRDKDIVGYLCMVHPQSCGTKYNKTRAIRD